MYRPYSFSPADFRPLRDAESQVRDLTQDFATSFNTGNYDQAASLFASDGALMAPLFEGAYGQRAIEHLLREMGEGGYSNLRMETMRVDHSGDMAMELGRFSVSMPKQNERAVVQRGKYVRVWRRLGAWLIVADCRSWTAEAKSDCAA
ncbi:MAG TPA: nuclear transport factor 2 family protein [Candidatus Sulfotelmatobacter sp.]|nr:nuclear transport factor 2 family protein [Candidatus Sulfotelmatobacter sp.]